MMVAQQQCSMIFFDWIWMAGILDTIFRKLKPYSIRKFKAWTALINGGYLSSLPVKPQHQRKAIPDGF